MVHTKRMHTSAAIPYESPLYPVAVTCRWLGRGWRLLIRVSDRIWGLLLQVMALSGLGLIGWWQLVG